MDLDLFRIAADIFSACIFLSAAAAKFRAPTTFEGQLANYRLLPEGAVAPAARVLPAIELLTGAGLLVTPFVRGLPALVAPVAAAGLLGAFAIAMAINLGRGRREIDCGCGDAKGRQPLSWAQVGRNLAIAAVLVASAALVQTPTGWAEVLEATVGGVVAFVLFLTHERLAAAASPPTYGPAL